MSTSGPRGQAAENRKTASDTRNLRAIAVVQHQDWVTDSRRPAGACKSPSVVEACGKENLPTANFNHITGKLLAQGAGNLCA
ncbi:hypothetical protein NHX12_030794 [Muraenolepis orangiensis]|uniref:Uncharacterized protein n=1 Tax=Muraenolepis orangiensis TaxID=630683 RepID=A0A9Q0ECR7_9TELE|nr:hypothetical protein NHX12_030794 [Muraenolepis orangiensis]